MGEKRKYTKAEDLVGTTYKGFKVLDCKRENRRSFLQVECPYCKKIKWIRKDQLDDPHRKGCGCLMTKTQFKQKDLVGERFGRLEVIKATSERDSHNGSVIWLCRCGCGKFKKVSTGSLKNGSVASCGCLGRENSSKNGKIYGKKIVDNYCIAGTNVNNLTAKIPKNNKSGHKGVHWNVNKGRWIAQIEFMGKHYNLGSFQEKEDAIKVREEAEKKMFGNFLEWYAETFPNAKKNIKDREKTSGKD